MRTVFVPCEVKIVGSEFGIAYYPDLYSQKTTLEEAKNAGIRQWDSDDFIVVKMKTNGHTVHEILGAYNLNGKERPDYLEGVKNEFGL